MKRQITIILLPTACLLALWIGLSTPKWNKRYVAKEGLRRSVEVWRVQAPEAVVKSNFDLALSNYSDALNRTASLGVQRVTISDDCRRFVFVGTNGEWHLTLK